MSDTLARLALGKHSGSKIVLAFVGLALLASSAPAWAAPSDMTVNALRQAGWTQVGKVERDEWHEGIAPYETLRRCIYTVTYTLEKEGKTVKCTMARDVMYDTFEQSCSSPK